MGISSHTIEQGTGSNGFSREDKVTMVSLVGVALLNSQGDPAAPAVSSGGAYSGVPTAAFGNLGATGASGVTLTPHVSIQGVPTIANPGSGGTAGAQTLTGSGDTGTEYQLGVTIAGGAITAINSVSVAGNLTAIGNVTNAALTGAGLTGAQANLTGVIGVLSVVEGGSSNHQYPQGTTAALSGGNPVTPGVLANPAVTPVNGQPSVTTVAGLSLPPAFNVQAESNTPGLFLAVTSKASGSIQVTATPQSGAVVGSSTTADILIVH